MEQFPSANELTVASALLLLSTSSSSSFSSSSASSPPLKFGFDHEVSKSDCSKNNLMSSTPSFINTNHYASSKPIPHRKVRIFTVVSRRREMKFQVARRRRTEVCWNSDHRKIVAAFPTSESSTSTSTEGSCLSSDSSARREYMIRSDSGRRQVEWGCGSGSAHIRRRAEAIMMLLSRASLSEFQIRQVLGDSPDTSKALRMLLKRQEIKRTGTGGRQDPYIYSVTQKDLGYLTNS